MAINKNLKKDVSIEKPKFDILFQMGVVKLCLTDDYFCTQSVKFLANDKDLDEYTIFDDKHLQNIFKIIAHSMLTYKSRPTEGQLRQKFQEFDKDIAEDHNDILDKILAVDASNDGFYRAHMKTYIAQVKMAKGFKKTQKIWLDHPDNAHEFMQTVIDDIRRVSFESEDTVAFSDLDSLLNEGANLNSRKIQTGIPDLDKDLVGGLPRQSLVVVLAGSNVGKSLFCTSLGANALQACDDDGKNLGYKILHINLEGMREEALMRYTANLAKINFGALLRASFSPQERQRIEQVQKDYGDRLLIRNMLGFGASIEDLVAYCREVHKDFKFDMLICDYGQLLDSKQKTEGLRHTMARVFRGLDSIGKELDCVVVTPAQATRNSQEKQTDFTKKKEEKAPILRMTDISEAMEIARVAAVIFTLNRTEEEEKSNKLRLFLEKQRQGAKNVTYGLITNYGQSNLITGKFYNPHSTVIEGESLEDTKKNESSLKTIKLPQAKTVETTKKNTVVENSEIIYDNDMQAHVDSEAKSFLKIREEFFKLKHDYDDEREMDDADIEKLNEMKDMMIKMVDAMKKNLMEIKFNIYQAFTDTRISKDVLDELKRSILDMKKSKTPDSQIKKTEMMIKIYEIFLELIKIPDIG